MTLIYVSGANPCCRTCHGTGVKPLLGYGTPCHCIEGIDDPIEHARREGRKAADASFGAALAKVFDRPLSEKTLADLKAIDDMTVISREPKL
jgi:hypothetical protein